MSNFFFDWEKIIFLRKNQIIFEEKSNSVFSVSWDRTLEKFLKSGTNFVKRFIKFFFKLPYFGKTFKKVLKSPL
jgi:hypothetical protein